MSTSSELVMSDIGHQLERAQEMQYLSLLVQNDSVITAIFYPHIKSVTVDFVVKHINIKYGKHVLVWRDDQDPYKIEIWHKEIAF